MHFCSQMLQQICLVFPIKPVIYTRERHLAYRIPLSLGNKVSSRLLARATRALLAPGSGPVSNANGKPIDSDSLATTGSAQSASSTTDLRDSISAVAVRNGAGNLIDNPTALGGNSQSGKLELEPAQDPFIKDTEDLVRSMQTSSPSWNAESPNTSTAAGVASPRYSQGSAVQTSVTVSGNDQYQGQRQSNGSSDSTYVMAESGTSKDGRLRRDGAIDMVVFEKGEGRKSVEGSVSSNGSRSSAL